MSCRIHLVCVSLLVSYGFVVSSHADDSRPVSYNRDIRPLLSDRCFHCHGPDEGERQADLRLDLADGDDGAYREAAGIAAVLPGSVEESELWKRITSSDADSLMPPPDSHKKALTREEQELIRRWIEQGAKYESFWAFIPPVAPDTVPAGSASTSPIDYLVRKRLADEGLSSTERADRRTLIRRLSLDLTGLPPTREEIAQFISDDTPNAYEELVDRLLESPHYGEQMTKYWLDVIRFADTNGLHHDHFRDLSTYRDWVIRSFNTNLPYDEFVKYQIAGDLYENPSQDQLVASGFHRLHLIIDRGTMLPEESFTRNVIDRVSSVGTAFLGLTLQCAVCHDHKYDPITARDFYSMAGFFNNIDAEPETGPRSGTDFLRGLQEPYINLPSPEQAQQLELLEERVRDLTSDVKALKGMVTKAEAAADQADPEEFAKTKDKLLEAEKELKLVAKERDDLLVAIPAAMIMKERSEVRPAHILIRGAYDKPGERVERGTPSFLPPMQSKGETKTRMDLANWLVDPQNPLTARVTVNRFWQQLFGVGLVKTSEDFGAQGEWPSHPDLLDFLAVRFVKSGWDVKAIMKEIVMSETYQRSSVAAPSDYRADPQNRLLARGSRYRLDSEMIRDQVLATSGKLNPQLYGKSVKPPQPDGLWQAVALPDTYPRVYQPDPGDQVYRRSVYTFWKRALPPPHMTIFNAPSREECIARRERTNTPLQALLLLNEAEYLKAAGHLASQTLAAHADAQLRLKVIYETITAQLPDSTIEQTLLNLADELEALYAEYPELAGKLCGDVQLPEGSTSQELAAWTMVASAIYNLDVTKTRQ